jgi:hypothetical protein
MRPEDRMEKFFQYTHLPERLQFVSKPFGELATWVYDNLPAGPERTVTLRKLLEAKDCAVRAQLENVPRDEGSRVRSEPTKEPKESGHVP